MAPEVLAATPGRLDAVVAALTGAPRADVQRAILAGRVTVDGEPRSKSFRLAGGERIEADLLLDDPLVGDGPPVPVRFRDDDLAVIAKPPGIITHPTAARRSGTLVNRLLAMGIPLAGGDPSRPGIVHRLDAGTSGLMVVATSEDAYRALQDMFKAHVVDRRYLALVSGKVEHDEFSVEAPLGRQGAHIVVDRSEGRAAETGFEVRERAARATLLEARPRTGRTHQIRVHLRAIGHPILGDGAYGGGGDDATALGLTRPFLHSWAMAFTHPITGEALSFTEPLPPDLDEALARARDDQRL
jgi:23S rRNA pseudouridine1911/1915/1917 synthase